MVSALGQALPDPPLLRLNASHDFISKGELSRSREALRTLQPAYLQSVAFEQSMLDRGRLFGDRGMADRAIGQYSRVFIEHSNSPYAVSSALEAGFMNIESSDLAAAVGHLKTAVRIVTRDLGSRNDTTYRSLALQSHYWLGACYAKLGQYDDAQREWTQCASLSRNDVLAAQALYAIAQVHEINGNDSLAFAAYNEVVTRFPRTEYAAESQIRRAVIFMKKRNAVRALDELQGIDLDLLHFMQTGDSARCALLSEYASVIRLQALAQQQRYRQAIDSATRALGRNLTASNAGLVRLSAGYSFVNLQQPDSALLQFDLIISSQGIERSEISQQALLYRAVCLQRLGREAEAEQLFTALSIESGYPYKAHALIEVGQTQYERQEYERAAKNFEKAEREATDASVILRAQIMFGNSMLQRQQWAKASSIFERAIALAEKSDQFTVPQKHEALASARLQRGIGLAQTNQTSLAIASLTDFLGNHPKDLRRDEAVFWLAECMYREDLLKNAQEFYEEIVRRYTASPRREEAMYGLAWTYFRRRDFTKSSKAFEELISTFPQSRYAIEAMVRRADGLYIGHQFKAAATQYEQAFLRGGSSEEAQYAGFQAGNAAYRDGDLDRSVRLMRAFVQKYPSSRLADDALYLVGWIAFQQQQDAEAIREFERLLQAYPDGDHAVRALYTIGDAQFNMGSYDASMATYRRVMAQYPSHPLAMESAKSLQEVLVGQGRTDEALAVLDTLIGLNPESVAAEDFSWSKAQIFYSGKNYSTAAAELTSYLKKYPSAQRKDEALYQLGKTYLSMNDNVQALQTFKELERQHPKSQFIETYRLDLAYFYSTNANLSASDSIYRIIWENPASDSAAASTAGYEIAEHARMRGDSSSAIEMYRVTADRFATLVNGAQARYKLAQLYRKNGRIDSARFHLQLLAQRVDQPSVVANVLYDLGTTYFRERDYVRAAEWFVRVREEYAGIEDWYTLSMLALGECYEQLHQKKEALEAYTTVAELRPDDDYGKTALARVKRLKGGRR
jgi:TolA-binding protein